MLEEFTTSWQPWQLALLGTAAAGVLLLLLVIWVLARRRPAGRAPRRPELFIDVAALDDSGPPVGGPQLELYGTPIRLAVVVLAPVGREGRIPAQQQLPAVMEQVIPGMTVIIASQQPSFRLWPGQLSSRGFINAFLNNVTLPGDRGKGTPWCSVAGKFRAGGQLFLAGLVACAAKPNGLGQFVIQHEGQWNDVLRIKNAE